MRVFILSLVVCLPGICQSIASEAPKPPAHTPASLELRDQYDAPQRLVFPATNVVVLTIADQKGSEQIDGWVAALKARYAGRIELRGLADVGGVPGFLRGKVRKRFQETRTYPVMLDWSGKTCAALGYQAGVANLVVFSEDGVIRGRIAGPATPDAIAKVEAIVATATRPGSGSQAPKLPASRNP